MHDLIGRLSNTDVFSLFVIRNASVKWNQNNVHLHDLYKLLVISHMVSPNLIKYGLYIFKHLKYLNKYWNSKI